MTATEVVGSTVVTSDHQAIRTRQAAKAEKHSQRKRQAIEMRRSGYTFDQIAAQLGISQQGASKMYKAAILDTYRRPAEEERELELSRVDGILRRWWPKLLDPDDDVADKASNHIRWVLHYRAELLGLKITRLDVKVSEGITIPADNDVWEQLRAMRQQASGQVIDVEALPAPSSNGHAPENGATP